MFVSSNATAKTTRISFLLYNSVFMLQGKQGDETMVLVHKMHNFSLVPSPLHACVRKAQVKRVALPCPGVTYNQVAERQLRDINGM